MADSTRPQSIQKTKNDILDIFVLLEWLAEKKVCIHFEGYPEKPKRDLLSGVMKLYTMHVTVRPLLEKTLEEEDLLFISN